MNHEHDSEWLGYPVEAFDPEKKNLDFKNTIYRIAVDWEDERTLADYLALFLQNPASADAPGLSIGTFGEHDSTPDSLVEALVASRARLPNLKGLFIGDIISEENEISWIQQGDLSALFKAFPQLEHFRARGGNGLVLGRIDHANLRSLVIETGGLPRSVVRDILASSLPALEHLEIYTGTENYGWDGTIDDFKPLFEKTLFPSLKRLGLRNSEIADDLAAAWSKSSAFPGLQVLDLSLGTLSDAGAVFLLESPLTKSLSGLDLHHHYLSAEMLVRLKKAFPFADLADMQSEADWDGDRYVAVSE